MASSRSRRRRPRIPLWRRARRVVLLASIAWVVAAAFSYLPAMGQRHNVGLGVSSVEWMRQHSGNALVSEIEAVTLRSTC